MRACVTCACLSTAPANRLSELPAGPWSHSVILTLHERALGFGCLCRVLCKSAFNFQVCRFVSKPKRGVKGALLDEQVSRRLGIKICRGGRAPARAKIDRLLECGFIRGVQPREERNLGVDFHALGARVPLVALVHLS
jgi:hypothetical protein